VATFAVFVIAAFALAALRASATSVDAVKHTNEIRDHLNRVGSDFADAETGQRGYLLTGLESYLEPYNRALASLPSELAALRRLTADNRVQQQALEVLEPTATRRLEQMAHTTTLQRADRNEAAIAFVRAGEGQLTMERLRALLVAMDVVEVRLLEERTAAAQRDVTFSTYVTFGGSLLLLCAIGLIAVLASRDFRAREVEAWLRRVQTALSDQLQGDLDVEVIGEKILGVLVEHLGARVAAVYVTETGGQLRRVAAYALEASTRESMTLRLGEGLVGQAAKDDRLTHLREVPDGYLPISSASGRAKSREVVIAPASVDGAVQAVTELGFLHCVDATELEVFARIADTIAAAVRSARDRHRLEELLAETQQQSEELQTQQEELRVSNEELEQQSRTLQLSQTRLENQQAETEQINTQLEEQTQSLEQQRDALALASAELQRASAYKSEFLANMSHELRTPLNSTLILAKLLSDNREGNLTAEQIKFAQTISSAGNDLLTLINDILDLSKIEAGKLDVRPEAVSIARLIDDLSSTFTPVAAGKSLELTMSIRANTPDTIETDPTRLRQILKNLLSNALKFTERGGVSLVVSSVEGRLRFAVRDTGIGIAADQHELVFEAFRQADGRSNRKFGGTGLGLSISRDLARLLDGELSVESAPGRGSTFTLDVPAHHVGMDVEGGPTASAASPSGAGKTREPVGADARPTPVLDDRARLPSTARSLLIVDDDPVYAEVIQRLGRELGFLCLAASTAEEALTLARRYRPSAIVLDVGLPDRSGLTVLDALKRESTTRHIPVHVISGTDHAKTALEMGAAGYALKPVAREKLVEAIQRLEQKFTQKLRRVLVVEDDATLRESTARLLAAENVEVIAVGTTAQALEHLAATTFDCMVLDLSLPDRSGLELLSEMSRENRYGVPPVIVYTGRSLSREQVRELEQFSSSIIVKGARSPERLLDEVTLFLHQVESELPPARQRMLRDARDRESAFDGRRILIVEDDVRNVFALTSVLEPRGAKLSVARNGREALDLLATNPDVDLVLMDMMMPVMDGLQATREIRKQPQFDKLPIIALTAKAMIDDREDCLAAGANDYIAKPLDVDKLLSLARVWIRK
jgi:CheY-like chemotaxis protein/CHASE3 domain sensor protein